jgi:hypothetical protein
MAERLSMVVRTSCRVAGFSTSRKEERISISYNFFLAKEGRRRRD